MEAGENYNWARKEWGLCIVDGPGIQALDWEVEKERARGQVWGGAERSRQLAKASKRHPVALTPKHFPKQKDFTVRKDVSAALRV